MSEYKNTDYGKWSEDELITRFGWTRYTLYKQAAAYDEVSPEDEQYKRHYFEELEENIRIDRRYDK